ncbi:hypothetical protein [Streptomyces ortus]|uniref:Uncharacterized protein n=1 Tax=Streptomyces ortus TaxID=2867268 RepID=A0ABT3UX44_9ACTN|nr:hypothetical protein [Streptomyces ortus]MCX4232062.1 hypothetical protein [Streptomyces ortus]
MTVACATPDRRPSADEILDTPLPDLLGGWGVELFDSSIADATFFGAVIERKTGEIVLAMPTGRSEREHDTMARYLLAQVFDVDLPKLPPPFTTDQA